MLTYTANMQTSLIGLEACSGAHFLGRPAQAGARCPLIPAQFVKLFVKSNNNNFIDAEAIIEAVERKNMRSVPIKTDDQLDSRRTAGINQLRAFLPKRAWCLFYDPYQFLEYLEFGFDSHGSCV